MVFEKPMRPAVMGREFMVSSGHYLASMAALKIFQNGGNAIDAGVAGGIALNVVHPDMTSFGGVAPIILYSAEDDKVTTISGLGCFPKSATLEFYTKSAAGDLPEGVLRSVVPAAADAWISALERYGTKSFMEVAAPAIQLAEDGFPAYRLMIDDILEKIQVYRRYASSTQIFLRHGNPPNVGELFVQKDLARTLKKIVRAEETAVGDRQAKLIAARDYFYKGEIAKTMVTFCEEQGGLLTTEDLAAFHVELEAPIVTKYKDEIVYSCGPWCQGPALPQTLNILDNFDLKTFGHNTTEYIHVLTEALKLVFADREKFYGDPRYVDVPIDALVSKEYAHQRSKLISRQTAWPELPPSGDPVHFRPADKHRSLLNNKPTPVGERGNKDTSQVCAIDAKGNMFSATPSDGPWDTPIVPGLGFIISSRGSQSWIDKGHASCLAPGKRPRLTPNPALVFHNGQVSLAFGTPGADSQVQALTQMFLNLVEFLTGIQEAVEAPRFISASFPASFWPHEYYPGRLYVEGRIPSNVREDLSRKGHEIEQWPDWSPLAGGICAVMKDQENKVLMGAADPRRESYALGW
ncbi:MAG: gamma-glutamyltransferase family protein [Candidatus Bathyarchaeia archaeon]